MKTSIRRKLGKKIKETRRRLSYTQERLSELTNMDYKYIQRIEGKNPPDIRIETLQRIAKALKTTPSKLLDF